MKIVKRIFCHHEWQFERNIYGDEINWVGGCRSWWVCPKCGAHTLGDHLYFEKEDDDQVRNAGA